MLLTDTYTYWVTQNLSRLVLLPCRVVIVWWYILRWGAICSREPCHLQGVLGHGQEYGRNSQISSCSSFSVCRMDTAQPDAECLQVYVTVLEAVTITDMRKFPTKDIIITTTTKIRHIKIHWTPKAYYKRYKFYFEHWRLSEDERHSKFWKLNLHSLQQPSYSHRYRFLEHAWTNFESQVTRRTKFCTMEPNIFGPHSGSCVMPPFWRTECWGCSKIFVKFVHLYL